MTTPGATLSIRPLTDDDWPAVADVDAHAFGATMPDELLETERALLGGGRLLGAHDGSTLIGITAAYDFDVTVPGAVVPAAGVTWVGVLPTHRRRGALRTLMERQLHDLHEQGREPLAILWASEPQIYGRFGYGLASQRYSFEVARGPDALRADAPRDPSLRLRLVDAADWKLVAAAYDEAAAARPGMLARDERYHLRAVRDVPSMRHGRSALRCVVAEDDHQVRGYARYSTKPGWSDGRPTGTVDVREVIAVDEPARAALYRYLFDLDLMSTIELWNVPVDDPLLHWLTEPRSANPTWRDALYARLVDLPGALASRTYTAEVDVVLDVTDPVCPWNEGRWRLTGGPEGSQCRPSGDDADLALSVAELGAAFLGGTSLFDLATAGRVASARTGAVAEASRAFATLPQPWCPVIF